MRRRIFSLLLLPLVLANQAVCLAHVHQETDVGEPDRHGDCPHVHLPHTGHGHAEQYHGVGHSHARNAGHHTHSEPSHRLVAIAPVPDHDDDAIYCADAAAVATGRGCVKVIPADYLIGAAILSDTGPSNDCSPRAGPRRAEQQGPYDSGCPIYLRALSLRL